MAAGHAVEVDGRLWTIGLRDGLRFHDGEPVRARDVVASIARWARRDSFGQSAMAAVAEMRALDDRQLTIRLHRPFPQLLEAMAKPGAMFVMPERIATTESFTALTDPVGSGPYRLLRDEWAPGARATYRRFDGYVPRNEPAHMLAGGKRARFDRIEWHMMPDPATAATALQAGEVDWWEAPQADLLQVLGRHPAITIEQLNSAGTIYALRPNHAQPPFSSPALRRAIWPVLHQADVIAAVAGADYARRSGPVGYFTPGTPLASDVGMEILMAPRSLDAARRALEVGGYKGETLAFLHPTDIPALDATGAVVADMLRRVGFAVESVEVGWAAIAQRRARRGPVAQGGWSAFCTVLSGADCLNPATNPLLRADGPAAFFGWPESPAIETERMAWLASSDLASQRRHAEALQRQAFLEVPYWPLGHYRQPAAYRRGLVGLVPAPVPVMWNVEKLP
jgi:peptide/nickel transport system substrate-binding protein